MSDITFYHGSMDHLPVGTRLAPRAEYEQNWGDTLFYQVLEHYRPEGARAHHEAIFLCAFIDDIDLCGGGTEWVFTVEPEGSVSRHDMNWSSEISCLADQGHGIESDAMRQAAENYWAGVPHHNESVWEYLASGGCIVQVERYDEELEPARTPAYR